jgi:uncharacterized protein involved in cysteine biosynthesis
LAIVIALSVLAKKVEKKEKGERGPHENHEQLAEPISRAVSNIFGRELNQSIAQVPLYNVASSE